jgi:two-component system OmpR family response regulator
VHRFPTSAWTSAAHESETDGVASGGEHLETRSPSILLIDDDLELSVEIARDLASRGYRVVHAATGPEGLSQARRDEYDLTIIDRMLAGDDGLTVIEILRGESVTTPIIILSALNAVDDRVRGLRAGGDDYLAKPFAPEELAARIEALLRRVPSSRATSLRVGPLTLDLIERRAWRTEREIELLPREFKLLEYFMRRPGQIITRTMLLEDVWQYRFVPETRLVDVHMSKLRRKVDGAGDPPMLLSIRSAGFMLNAPA